MQRLLTYDNLLIKERSNGTAWWLISLTCGIYIGVFMGRIVRDVNLMSDAIPQYDMPRIRHFTVLSAIVGFWWWPILSLFICYYLPCGAIPYGFSGLAFIIIHALYVKIKTDEILKRMLEIQSYYRREPQYLKKSDWIFYGNTLIVAVLVAVSCALGPTICVRKIIKSFNVVARLHNKNLKVY